MEKGKKISRKTFFKWASLFLLVPFFKLWQKTVDSSQTFASSPTSLTISQNLPDGIHFFDRVILIKEHGEIRLFSSKCTHLGCRINKSENGELVCPCHGSRYNISGKPVKGPAVKNLTAIEFDLAENNGNIVIQFNI